MVKPFILRHFSFAQFFIFQSTVEHGLRLVLTYLLLTLLDFFCSWDETIGDYYYFNSDTGDTQWAHPLDEIYKQKVTLAREQFNNAEDKNQNNIVTDSNVAVSSDGDTSDVLSKSKMDKPLKLVSKKKKKNHQIWKIITYL